MTELNISFAEDKDVGKIAAISYEVSMVHYENCPDEFKLPQLENDYHWIAETVHGEDVKLIKAELDDKICGYLVLYLQSCPEQFFVYSKTGFVGSIGVKNGYQGQGIGTAMLKFAEDYLRSVGIKVFDIDFYTFNKDAERLYDKYGFEDIKHYKRKML